MGISFMIMLVGISGAGKSTLRDYALGKNPTLKKLIAVTDRPQRLTEQNGIDKFFVTSEEFETKHRMGELCLVNMVYNKMYAFQTSDFSVGDVFLGEIYYQNIQDFKEFHPNSVFIYVKPIDILLAARGVFSRGDSEEAAQMRKSKLFMEAHQIDVLLGHGYFDYTFFNNYTEESLLNFNKLIQKILFEHRR